ncbi:hypothetical protein SDC9_186538 [bioreactor metagenome]|uniref:Uncharacterized protein n=1 Tax=bioreactor metagenome TaxID=1076179 RepID=A0A645HKS9_9ZZZZ
MLRRIFQQVQKFINCVGFTAGVAFFMYLDLSLHLLHDSPVRVTLQYVLKRLLGQISQAELFLTVRKEHTAGIKLTVTTGVEQEGSTKAAIVVTLPFLVDIPPLHNNLECFS